MTLLDPLARLSLRSRIPARVARTATLLTLGALAACKATETPKAPEGEATGPAAPEATSPAPVADSPAVSSANVSAANVSAGAAPSNPSAPSIHAFTMKRLDGSETSLSAWAGKVLLVVNTASKCGYTPQYQGLQELHTQYSKQGFEVLGFPSNDFGGQEPGDAKQIQDFCISMYSVNFPMFEKTKTTGPERSPLYALLSEAKGEPKWNFHKYLIDKQGRPVQAWESKVVPGSAEIKGAIEAQLAAP